MARQMLERKVTRTTVKSAHIKLQDGRPVAIEVPDQVFLGNVRLERAQRLIDQKFEGKSVTVLEVTPETLTYVLPVEKFIELATVKVEDEEN